MDSGQLSAHSTFASLGAQCRSGQSGNACALCPPIGCPRRVSSTVRPVSDRLTVCRTDAKQRRRLVSRRELRRPVLAFVSERSRPSSPDAVCVCANCPLAAMSNGHPIDRSTTPHTRRTGAIDRPGRWCTALAPASLLLAACNCPFGPRKLVADRCTGLVHGAGAVLGVGPAHWWCVCLLCRQWSIGALAATQTHKHSPLRECSSKRLLSR